MDDYDDDFEEGLEQEEAVEEEDLWDLIRDAGQEIVRLSWDGGGFAHCGSTQVYLHEGRYYVDCEVEGLLGPFATLDEALERGGFHFAGTPNPELDCVPELENNDAILAAAYDLAAEPGGVVLINGDAHIRLGKRTLALRDPDDGRLTTVYLAPPEEENRAPEPEGWLDLFAYAETKLPPSLVNAYFTTDYHVFGEKGGFTLRLGHRSPELEHLFHETGVAGAAFITAANPFSQPMTEEENDARLDQLRAELIPISAAVLSGEGQGLDPSWPTEKSFLALGIRLEQARALGEKYGQNAILWSGENAVPKLMLLR